MGRASETMSRWRNQLSYAPVDVLRILIVCGVESTPDCNALFCQCLRRFRVSRAGASSLRENISAP